VFDINVGCGLWPFRPTPSGDVASMEALLRAEGITQACAYPLEAYLWPDPQEANQLRLPELAESSFFVPSAVLNPTLPGCLKSYEQCRQEWEVPMIRLLPGYHLYELDHPGVDTLAEKAAQDKVILGIHLRAEDERMQNPIAMVPFVPLKNAVALAKRHTTVQVVVFGVGRLGEAGCLLVEGALRNLAEQPDSRPRTSVPDNLWIELSFFEFESSFANAVKVFPVERLLFGTHAPLFYPRCNVLKIRNSEASASAKKAVLVENAMRLLEVSA